MGSIPFPAHRGRCDIAKQMCMRSTGLKGASLWGLIVIAAFKKPFKLNYFMYVKPILWNYVTRFVCFYARKESKGKRI